MMITVNKATKHKILLLVVQQLLLLLIMLATFRKDKTAEILAR